MTKMSHPNGRKLVLQDIFQEIVDTVNNEHLFSNKEIIGFRFGYTDAEHFLCKGWVTIKETFHHYRNSKYLNPSEPHLHPLKLPETGKGKSFFADDFWEDWFDQIVDAFFEIVNNDDNDKRTVLPDLFQIPEIQQVIVIPIYIYI
jgi:hypothetical protein